ncbi:MAG: hypothetical protein ORN29_00905 [Rhodoferax sp.]|nr:hypothetical protein [Rhodoferax sp.]
MLTPWSFFLPFWFRSIHPSRHQKGPVLLVPHSAHAQRFMPTSASPAVGKPILGGDLKPAMLLVTGQKVRAAP